MERKPTKKHARSRSGALASFLRSTAASFSSSTATTFGSRPAGGGKASFNHRNAFSGPMVSIVPPEARGGGGRRRGGSKQGGGSGYRTPEASSPKVSCIGQIKRSKSKTSKARKAAKNVAPAAACGMDGGACPMPPRPPVHSRPKRSLVRRMFSRRSRSRPSSSSSSHKSSGAADLFKGRPGSSAAVAAAPVSGPGMAGLGQMKRFTSGRGAFQDFDWREAERRGSDVDVDDDYVDDGFVAFSAPLVLGGGVVASEPRKEVNLWRRRPMSPPTPLELP
ncbi:uncharacterized protein At1g76070-like [Triticum urartu]|uniref:Syringolide-induced protein 14-1-1 n=1 Tax=Triticum urartu TaxID=4572 RepID=A0A8R7UIB8_TRIUA|nr:uncharacterized protein At1g76070-like [Triticum urartu]